ncbi:MAG: hypothetical protein R3C52_06580 [Hyphomonadaceae bacterium]
MKRALAIAYSLVCYAIGVAALVYLILFVADLLVPVRINTASSLAPKLGAAAAVLWDVALVAIWGFQHTAMASSEFKAWWTRYVPAPIERSTYLVFVAIMTALLAAFWAPLPGVIYDVSGTGLGLALLGVYFFGWVITLISTFLINHFHLFGLQQAVRMTSATESKKATFRTPLFYKVVRHPMMTGILISLWAAPELTVGRLVFNLAMTAYIIIAVRFEERTLVQDLGDEYKTYRRTTPGLIPALPVGRVSAT